MYLQVKAANPAHLTATFCPAALICIQKTTMGIKVLAYFCHLLIKNRQETIGQILEKKMWYSATLETCRVLA